MKRRFIGVVLLGLVLSACGGGGSPFKPQTFTVLWENYDGTVLEKDTEVIRGSWPEYNGRTPQRKSDEQYSYTFYGWSPELTSVYKDITYIAQYSSQLEKAKIVFDLDGGTTNHATVPVYSSTISASDFFFDVTKPNYSFRGWQYNGTLVFDQFGNKLSNPSIRETMTFVASYSQNVYLSITKNIEEAGDVYGAGTYDYYSRVELSASPNEGYTFDGWYYKNVAISYQPNLTYTVDTTDINIEARFSLSYYRLEIESVHPSLGSVAINDHYKVAADGANIKYKSDVLVSAQSSTEEYSFLGWYDTDGKLVSPSYVYNFKMPNHNYSLFAKWDAPSYMVTINKNYENAGTVSGEGLHEYSTSVTVSQTTNNGYVFDGWYIDGIKKGQLEIYRFNMPMKNVTIDAIWNLISYNITYVLNGGTNSSNNPKTYSIESNFDLYNPTRTGYNFDGWTLNGKTITTLGNDLTGDITLVANWSIAHYSILLNPNGGELGENAFEIDYNQSYTLPTPTRLGYKFIGWKSGSSSISQSGTWKYTNVTSLTAQWSIIVYTITYELNGGTNSLNNPASYTVEDNVVFDDPSNFGYVFLGWFENDLQVTGLPSGNIGDVTIEAKWSAVKNNLSVASNDVSKGTALIISGSGYSGEEITVSAVCAENCVFDGWYCESAKISPEAIYTFTMPTNDISLIAHFFTKGEAENGKKYGTLPIVSDDGMYVTYGLYPQNNVNDYSLISTLNELNNPEPNGWYLYNNEYYAKMSANPSGSDYIFDNGTSIVKGRTYWFKCEPIVWKIVKVLDNEYIVTSSTLLDVHNYHGSTSNRIIDDKTVYSNNYKNSDIRLWLNNGFYDSSFALDDKYIQTSIVDNSADTTRSEDNIYACENTNDKVFLLSYKDLSSSGGYGFSTDESRRCRTTDWARVNGAYYGTNTSSCYYNGWYWTRTPDEEEPYYAWRVEHDGDLWVRAGVNIYLNLYVTGAYVCVRPTITIKIA